MKQVKNKFTKLLDKGMNKISNIKNEKEKEFEKIEKIDKQIEENKNKKTKLPKFDLDKSDKNDTSRFLKFWLIGAMVAYISFVVFNSLNLLYLIIAAYIISIAMEILIEGFQKFLPRVLGIIISYLLLLVLLLSGFIIIIPFVLAQSADIMQSFIDIISGIQNDLKSNGLEYVISNSNFIPGFLKNTILDQINDRSVIIAIQTAIQDNISQIASIGTGFINNVGSIAVNIIGGFFSAISQVLLVFVLAIFLSLQKDSVMNFIGAMSSNKDYVIIKLKKLYKKLGFWLKGQFLLSIFIFITVFILLNTISFFGMDLPNKFTLALISGLTEFIPILGPVLGAIPAMLVAISEFGFIGFITIVVIYTLIQGFENYILVPLVMNQALGVSPLLIIIAMLLGGSLMGFVGIVLSVPIAVISNLIFEDIIKE
ncbi:AI-2E family transporter [Candidatus Vampirococcus lugosii]|uniref:PurR-regulated permease PerM n=1 Tax=Candidatus Vampirococcus lugosii TaxID=2789015 RepID=A0ABS5QPI7_9BACT|nr:AI-2E family transporter [Candidatus Vampirococcus lugosii]MBS8122239.1 putative PurR-regulated permease PerM [Candidatus Vampirococcus lugosii]